MTKNTFSVSTTENQCMTFKGKLSRSPGPVTKEYYMSILHTKSNSVYQCR